AQPRLHVLFVSGVEDAIELFLPRLDPFQAFACFESVFAGKFLVAVGVAQRVAVFFERAHDAAPGSRSIRLACTATSTGAWYSTYATSAALMLLFQAMCRSSSHCGCFSLSSPVEPAT